MRQSQFLFRLTLFALAVGCVATIIWHVGPAIILQNLRRVGWRISFVFLLGFPRFLLNTLSWRIFLPNHSVPFRRLYWTKVSGELLSRATPAHFLGGDAMRLMMLKKAIPSHEAAASILMDRTAMFLGGAVFILLGLFSGMFLMPLPLPAKAALSALGIAAFTVLLFLIAKQKQGMLESFFGFLDRFKITRLIPSQQRERWRERLPEIDASVRSYYDQRHGKLIGAAAMDLAARLVAALEVYLLFVCLGIPLGFFHALLFFATSLVLVASLFVIPGALGVSEGAYAFFFHVLGLNPALGVSLELSRKINAVLWYLFGGILALVLRHPAEEPFESASPAVTPSGTA